LDVKGKTQEGNIFLQKTARYDKKKKGGPERPPFNYCFAAFGTHLGWDKPERLKLFATSAPPPRQTSKKGCA
jgi:hypothetical protein